MRGSLCWLVVLAIGCETEMTGPADDSAESGPPRASVTLRVAVVSDPDLTRAIGRLTGEWNVLTDGQIETVEVPSDADLASACADADLVVFPSRAIGELCEADALRPVRSSVLESETLRFEDFLPLVRDQEIVYAQQVMALPLGCPTPLLLTVEDEQATRLALPADEVELALAYLAWAAPHAVHRSRVATLFDADDFSPRLTAPPFVRALESFVAAAGEGHSRIVWPRRDAPPESPGLTPRLLPGADQAYNTLADQWEEVAAGERHATLVASSGRLIGVTTASRNAATAFRYAAWLAAPDNAREIATASDRVANCRGSLARSADAWRDSADRDLAKAFAATAADALRERRYLLTPRLPGADDYLGALANKLRDALDGEPASEALWQAAVDWEAISQRLGRTDQRAAYQRSLNTAGFPRSDR